jgi:hypothetical protein
MNVPVALACHNANWRFRGSSELDDWLSGRPWKDRGGTSVLRIGSASMGEKLARAISWAVRGLDDGEREPHIPVLRFPSESATPLLLLQEATGTAPRGNEEQQHRELASALQAWTTVAVVLPPEATAPAQFVRQTGELIGQLRKASPEARATLVFLDTAAFPLLSDPLDFTVGGPSDPVLGFDKELWKAYVHARLAWETGGDLARALAWDALGFQRLGVGADDSLENLLNQRAEEEYRRLPPPMQARAQEAVKQVVKRVAKPNFAGLMECGAFWKPPGESGPRPTPWLARAMLRLNLAPEAAFLLRSCLVCAPLAREVLGRCFDLEARERAVGFANRGTLPPPPDAVERFKRFSEKQPDTGAEFYPADCPARPSDPWAFTVFGEFLNSLPFDRDRRNFTNGLRTLRNALAHGHYICWAVLSALRKLEREKV